MQRITVLGATGFIGSSVLKTLARNEVTEVRAQWDNEIAGMRAQLREIHASRSWRLTAPLRRISTYLQAKSQRT